MTVHWLWQNSCWTEALAQLGTAAFWLPRKGWCGSFTTKCLTSRLTSMADIALTQVRVLFSKWTAFHAGFAQRRASWEFVWCWGSWKDLDVLIKVGSQMKLYWWGIISSVSVLKTLCVQCWLSNTNTFQNIFTCVGFAVFKAGLVLHGICIFRIANACCICFLFWNDFFFILSRNTFSLF